MHIPDGFLDAKTVALTSALAAGGLAVAARQVNRTLPRHKVPLMGLGAAFVFAAQMLNFPVLGGTSGHLLGGVLATVLLGPGAGVIVIACVLIVQALLFSDGGVLALGANIFNMAFVGGLGGYAIYQVARKCLPGLRGRITAVFFAAWLSTVLAAAAAAGALAFSGTARPAVIFPAMIGVHVFIGLGEALITSLIILAIARTRPDLLEPVASATAMASAAAQAAPDQAAPAQTISRGTGWEFLTFGVIIALGLAVFVAPYACSWPDGLDKVAGQFGFARRAVTLLHTWMPDYQIAGVNSTGVATALAGALGVLMMFGLACVAGWALVRSGRK